jgi:hypothetical protein
MADDRSTDASKVEKLLKYHEKVCRYHYDNPHKILKSLQKQQKILESMQLEKPDFRHWYPSYLAEKLVMKDTRASEWTYNRMFEEAGQRHSLGVDDEYPEVDEKMCILLHFILIMNRKLQELIRRSILYIHPRPTGQENAETPYKILRFDDYTEATNFEMLSEHAMQAQDGSLLSKIQDAWKVNEGKVCHFDDGERSADFVEFAEYIKTMTESIRDRFLQEAKKTGKEGKELYAEPGIMALKREFIDTLWKPFLTRDFESLCGEPRSPLDGHYAWYYGSVYRGVTRGNSSSTHEWAMFCHTFGLSSTLNGAWNDRILDYNLAAEDGVKRTLEQYYRLHWDDDDFAGQSGVTPVPQYVQFVFPPVHVLPSAGLLWSNKNLRKEYRSQRSIARDLKALFDDMEGLRSVLCEIYAVLQLGPGPTDTLEETTDAHQLRFAVFEIIKALVQLHSREQYSTHPIVGAAMPSDAASYGQGSMPKRLLPESVRTFKEQDWSSGRQPRFVSDFLAQAPQMLDYSRDLKDCADGLWAYFSSMGQQYVPECIGGMTDYWSSGWKLFLGVQVLREFAVFSIQHRVPVPGSLAPEWLDWTRFTEIYANKREWRLRGDCPSFASSLPRLKTYERIEPTASKKTLLGLVEMWTLRVQSHGTRQVESFRGRDLLEQLQVSVDALERHWQEIDVDEQTASECAEMVQVVRAFIDARKGMGMEPHTLAGVRRYGDDLLRELGQSANGYSLYKSLGVRRDATAQDIHAAYKVRSRQMHPDKRQQQGEDAAQATKDFQFLNRARQILGNPQTRAIYDKRGDEALDDDKLKRQHGEFSVV